MTSTEDIMESIRGFAVAQVPELKAVYDSLVPEQFLRPSLLIEAVKRSENPASAYMVEVTEYLTLTVFDGPNDHGKHDTRALLRLQERIRKLFLAGYLPVGTRRLNVTAGNGGRDWDRAYIDVQLTFMDLRDETPDTTPVMEELETNLTVKG